MDRPGPPGRGAPAASADTPVSGRVNSPAAPSGPLHLNDIDRLILQTEAKRLPPTGRTMSIDGVVVLEVDAGVITVERHFLHLAETYYQLGLVSKNDAAVANTARPRRPSTPRR